MDFCGVDRGILELGMVPVGLEPDVMGKGREHLFLLLISGAEGGYSG